MIPRTQPPDEALSWHYARMDAAMADMERKYSRYASAPEETAPRGPQRPAPVPKSGRYDLAMDALGAIVEAGDADEELTVADREERDADALFSLRETGYVRHCRNRSGETVEPEAFQKTYEAREQLRDDTLDIAFKLEAAGRRAFGSKTNPVAFVVCPLTGRFHVLPNVMGRNLFPTVAAAKRARLVAALELLLSHKAHRHDLFLTFSHGRRVTAGKLRAAFKAMHRKLSKLNGERFMRHYGARFIFRTSEVGGLVDDEGNEKRDESGAITYHPHAHVLMHLDAFLPRERMAELTRQIKAFWGEAWWGIDGAIEKVREACKYTVKPADLRRLSGPELVELDTALARLHLVQPLGVLRDQIRERRRFCLTIKRERRTVTEEGKKVSRVMLVVLPDWNARRKNRLPCPEQEARRKRRKEYRERVIAERLAWDVAHKAAAVPTVQGDLFAVPPVSPSAAEKAPEIAQDGAGRRPVIVNRVVARLSPAPYFDRVIAPALLVWNFNAAKLAEIQALPYVRPMLDAVGAVVERARAAVGKVSVHTSAVTVRTKSDDFPAFQTSEAWRNPKTRPETVLTS